MNDMPAITQTGGKKTSLRWKLVLAFSSLVLLPIVSIGIYADIVTRDLINNAARADLEKASNQTALQIDTYIAGQLDSIRTEAQQPFLRGYLETFPAERAGSQMEINVRQILVIFSRKDPVFINSYALLDKNGTNLLDTDERQIGNDEGEFDYFRTVFSTGLPFASTTLFRDENAFYISAPVRNEKGEIIGVLRAEYDTVVIQSMLLSILSEEKTRDFISIIDRNTYVRLADTGSGENLYKSIKDLSQDEILSLQSQFLLPSGNPGELTLPSHELLLGMENLSQEPFFEAYSDSIDEDSLITGIPLTTVPWVVLEGRSRETLTQPVMEQRRATILIALLVLFIATITAMLISQAIANPIVNLTSVSRTIAGGDLDASAPVLSNDEVGTLARTFNAMTSKLRQTLAGLETELRDRKQAEDILLQFRKVMDESNDAVYMIDPETSRYIDFNKSAHESLGFEREELSKLCVIDIAQHITSVEVWLERVLLVQQKGGLIFDTVYRRKDGTTFPVEVSARMLEYGGRTIMLAVVRDMTMRIQAENALRESEERFRTVFESSPIAICITSFDEGRLLDANYAYWDLTGYNPDESIGKTSEELKLWDTPEERSVFVQNLKLKRSLYNPDYEFMDVSGNKKYAISFYKLVQIGSEEQIISMFYDMSAQKQTIQALQQSEARVRALLEAIPDMIVELSLDGLVVNVIPPKGMEVPMPARQFIGRQIHEVLSESAAAQTLLAIERSLATNQISMFEFEEKMGKDIRAMEARIVPNTATTTIMMIRDITQRRWAETEREKLINELEQKNKESETLRESLASIVGTFEFSEIIQRVLDQIQLVVPYDSASVWRLEGNVQKFISGRDLPVEFNTANIEFQTDETNSALPILNGEAPYILNGNVQAELPDFQEPVHSYVNSWLAVPLKVRGNIIGLIALDGRQKDQFNEHHAGLAVTFANQVAIALENADLFSSLQTELEERKILIHELERKNAEAETLRESTAIVAATLEISETVQRILEQIKRVVQYDSASVWLYQDEHAFMMGSNGLPAGAELPGKYLLSEDEPDYVLWRDKVPYILLDDIQEQYPDFRKPPKKYIRGWLTIPLHVRGKLTGFISLDSRTPGKFTRHDAELALTFANQVSIALENARLFTDLQSELEERRRLIAELELKNIESETLRESAAIVAATLEKEETIDRILEQLERVIPFDSASVQLVEGNMLRIVSEWGFTLNPNESDNKFEINENEPAYPVLRGTVPYVLFDDVQLHVPAFTVAPHNRIHAWMAVPLKVKGQVTGIIALDGYRAGQFTARHAQLAVTYANQVAIALENSRLYSDLQSDLAIRQNLISELESKNAELERFTYTVSHDLKSPLFTIRGFLGYLEQDTLAGNRERMKTDIQRITDATEKMQRLLNELLELSRIGRLMNEPVYIPFEELAREAVELVQGRIMERGIAIHIGANLPTVFGDRPRLFEVVQNLVDNAAKFMGNQTEPRIEIGWAGEEDGKPILYVRDNGMGIPPEHHERIFGLFNKLDVKVDGTGIGLALVKRIVEVHRGRIWVQSEAGSGATFYFTLPASPESKPGRV